jgi:hypothetical protein
MIPTYENKADLFKWLKENKTFLLQAKKAQIKEADAVLFAHVGETPEAVNKAEAQAQPDPTKLQVKAVINTTNLMDSHDDVHIKGIWNKSLNEKKSYYLLQEHQMKFDKVISDEVKASAVEISWSELGQSYEGKTQALVFDANLEQKVNPFMFEQYQNGRVKNHSVGMQYVKIQLAVNSEDKYFKDEKEAWDKYVGEIVNRELAEDKGYFWVVTEAKIIEGSAVLVGSNRVTPTLNTSEPSKALTTEEPSNDTPPEVKKVDWTYIINKLNS